MSAKNKYIYILRISFEDVSIRLFEKHTKVVLRALAAIGGWETATGMKNHLQSTFSSYTPEK